MLCHKLYFWDNYDTFTSSELYFTTKLPSITVLLLQKVVSRNLSGHLYYYSVGSVVVRFIFKVSMHGKGILLGVGGADGEVLVEDHSQ